jgi:hypothetical protein
MTSDPYSSFPLVDSAIGTRLMLAFIASPQALQQRLRPPWQIGPVPVFSALGLSEQHQPNLLLIFHHLLLDQDAQGRALTDSGFRFVVFNIPAANPDTGEQGLVHFRMFTGGAIPGRYGDALPARVTHEYHLMEDNHASSISETFHVDPEAGGTLELHLAYRRGPLVRQVADRPNFPLWTTADPRILRVYQEDSVLELLRNDAAGLNLTQELTFRSTVPELADLFDGSEQLVAILGNPYYARKVFSPTIDHADHQEK